MKSKRTITLAQRGGAYIVTKLVNSTQFNIGDTLPVGTVNKLISERSFTVIISG